MKKVINGRRYDTDTAKALASASSSVSITDFHYWEETLYRKNTGEYFLYGEGGPMSRYSVATGANNWSGGWRIMPMTPEEARTWAESNLDSDEYEEIFGAVEEDAGKRTVTFSLTEKTIEKIATLAAEHGCSKSEVVEISIVNLNENLK